MDTENTENINFDENDNQEDTLIISEADELSEIDENSKPSKKKEEEEEDE